MNIESINPVSNVNPGASELEAVDRTPDTSEIGIHSELLHQAQSRDIEALTTIINQRLIEHGIKVAEIEFKEDILQLSVESLDVPEQNDIVPLLRHQLSQLQLSSVTAVTIYGQKVGQELPFWMETIELDLLIIEPVVTHEYNTGISGGEELPADEQTVPPLPDPETLPSEMAFELTEKYEAGERNFAQINLKDEALPGINLTLANLQEANLVWCDLRKASLSHANLTSAQLRHANLSNANLQGAKLQGTDLQGAKLQGANLSWAVLRGTNLTDADLTDVNFQNATLERVIMPDGTILD